MRPEWLINRTPSGLASLGHSAHRLATCCATNEVIEMPATATLPPKRRRAHAVSRANSSVWPAIRSSAPLGASAKKGSPP
jgi:hypothetical protein